SAALYVLTTLLDEKIPINSGVMRAVDLVLPKESIVNASKPRGLAGGNVETSQRITDVLLGAFSKALPGKIPAASQGTMNNITFGGRGFAYYETVGGGSGAGSSYHGESGVHTHMTNSLNTPVEALEIDFPVEIVNYSIRENSGGKGKFNGGNGLTRTYKFLEDVNVSILSERRLNQPYGLHDGEPGEAGENTLLRAGENGDSEEFQTVKLGSKVNTEVKAGDVLIVKTPGG
ncbi:MAG: hydantoinase B/oxoprolinase family protein, partial [bacterium]|nr:hydantoinase B/oxoprolinase family protein [bacterium]